MSDFNSVEYLREYADREMTEKKGRLMHKAADEIVELRARLISEQAVSRRLYEALEEIIHGSDTARDALLAYENVRK